MILGKMDKDSVNLVSVLDPSSANLGSDSKLMDEKRKLQSSKELAGENFELCHKRIKMRGIESVLHSHESSLSKPVNHQTQFCQNEEVLRNMDGFSQDHVDPKNKSHIAEKPSSNVVASRIYDNNKSLLVKKGKDRVLGSEASKSHGFNLHVDCVSNLVQKNPFHPHNVYHQLKSREDSECGSSTVPLEENASLRRWKEIKQNGFLSSSTGSIQIPKRRGRKSKSDTMKKKMELAKKEEINRFTKIAAPSGLLTGLNPGIITHVRNSKQVHSIIKALVRSEKIENRSKMTGAELMKGTKDTKDHRIGLQNIHDFEAHRFGLSHKEDLSRTLKGTSKDAIYVAYKKVCSDTSGTPNLTSGSEDDMLTLKLSSSLTMPLENRSSVYTEESASKTSITSLSVKAATVASQWLELLYQDIRGRLAALERSKKRLEAVMQIELPLLISREFSSEQDNNIISSQSSSTAECHKSGIPDIHRARWSAVFGQMEKALSEEGKQLERCLNQVKQMQLHCEWGLQCVNWHDFELPKSEDDSRPKQTLRPEKELSVMAAAASIYSTCNLVMAKENVFCF